MAIYEHVLAFKPVLQLLAQGSQRYSSSTHIVQDPLMQVQPHTLSS